MSKIKFKITVEIEIEKSKNTWRWYRLFYKDFFWWEYLTIKGEHSERTKEQCILLLHEYAESFAQNRGQTIVEVFFVETR